MIELLPENVANQIAAGEVIQRPSSAVKELLENAVDARSTKIQLIVKDAGKSLVQVIDNGFGMSASDAEKCFKKHATSKIKSADDLFNISSKNAQDRIKYYSDMLKIDSYLDELAKDISHGIQKKTMLIIK